MKLFYLEVLSKTSKDKGKQQVVFQYVSLESGCDGKGIFLTRYQEYVWEKRSLATSPRCLKITENVSFEIASEGSNAYIFGGQKLTKHYQKWILLAGFLKPQM